MSESQLILGDLAVHLIFSFRGFYLTSSIARLSDCEITYHKSALPLQKDCDAVIIIAA